MLLGYIKNYCVYMFKQITSKMFLLWHSLFFVMFAFSVTSLENKCCCGCCTHPIINIFHPGGCHGLGNMTNIIDDCENSDENGGNGGPDENGCVRMTAHGKTFRKLYKISDLPKSSTSGQVELNFTATGYEPHVIFSEKRVDLKQDARLSFSIATKNRGTPDAITIFSFGEKVASKTIPNLTGPNKCQFYSIIIKGTSVKLRLNHQKKSVIKGSVPSLRKKKLVYFGLASYTCFKNTFCFLCRTCTC